MVINVQLSHSSLPLVFNKGKGANTGIPLTDPHQYGKEVLKSHTNFHILIMPSRPYSQSKSVLLQVFFFFWSTLVFSFVIKINSQDILWNSSPLLNYCCFAHCSHTARLCLTASQWKLASVFCSRLKLGS